MRGNTANFTGLFLLCLVLSLLSVSLVSAGVDDDCDNSVITLREGAMKSLVTRADFSTRANNYCSDAVRNARCVYSSHDVRSIYCKWSGDSSGSGVGSENAENVVFHNIRDSVASEVHRQAETLDRRAFGDTICKGFDINSFYHSIIVKTGASQIGCVGGTASPSESQLPSTSTPSPQTSPGQTSQESSQEETFTIKLSVRRALAARLAFIINQKDSLDSACGAQSPDSLAIDVEGANLICSSKRQTDSSQTPASLGSDTLGGSIGENRVYVTKCNDDEYAKSANNNCGNTCPAGTIFVDEGLRGCGTQGNFVACGRCDSLPSGSSSSEQQQCEVSGGVWNECPMAPCPQGAVCPQVCEPARCESAGSTEQIDTTGQGSGSSKGTTNVESQVDGGGAVVQENTKVYDVRPSQIPNNNQVKGDSLCNSLSNGEYPTYVSDDRKTRVTCSNDNQQSSQESGSGDEGGEDGEVVGGERLELNSEYEGIIKIKVEGPSGEVYNFKNEVCYTQEREVEVIKALALSESNGGIKESLKSDTKLEVTSCQSDETSGESNKGLAFVLDESSNNNQGSGVFNLIGGLNG